MLKAARGDDAPKRVSYLSHANTIGVDLKREVDSDEVSDDDNDEESSEKKNVHSVSAGKVDEGTQCAICLETFEDAPEPTRLLVCGHTLHAECLQRCSRGSCPICRAPLERGPDDPLRVEPDKHFHKALRWPNILAAMRKQSILTGLDDAERMMSWFGAPSGGEVTFAMLKERLKDSTPMDDVDHAIFLLVEEADSDRDGKLNMQDITRLLANPTKITMARYCAIKLV